MKYILIYLDILGPLAALPFFFFKKPRDRAENTIFSFLMVQLLLNSISKLMMIAGANNIYIYQVNSFLSFAIAGILFLPVFESSVSKKRYLFFAVYFPVNLLILLLIILLEDASFFNSLSFSYTAFSICLFCVLFYFYNLSNPRDQNIVTTKTFWFISGFFIYYGGNFFIFLTYKIFTKMDPSRFKIVWGIHNVIFFIFCCLMLITVKWRKLKTYF